MQYNQECNIVVASLESFSNRFDKYLNEFIRQDTSDKVKYSSEVSALAIFSRDLFHPINTNKSSETFYCKYLHLVQVWCWWCNYFSIYVQCKYKYCFSINTVEEHFFLFNKVHFSKYIQCCVKTLQSKTVKHCKRVQLTWLAAFQLQSSARKFVYAVFLATSLHASFHCSIKSLSFQ